ncbi:hypothetical protein CEE92_11340, partial [Lactobacillus crispatus]
AVDQRLSPPEPDCHILKRVETDHQQREEAGPGQDRIEQWTAPNGCLGVEMLGNQHDLRQDPRIEEGQPIKSIDDAVTRQDGMLVQDQNAKYDP